MLDRGTVETQRKLRRGTLERLKERRILQPQQGDAADEIERVYLSIVGSLMPAGMAWERRDMAHRDAGLVVPPRLRYAYRQRYLPWAVSLARAKGVGGPPVFDTVIDVVINGVTAATLDRARRVREGTSARWLLYGLNRYAQLAGWLQSGRERAIA